MRNKYTHQQLQQEEQEDQQEHKQQQRSTKFLPMLCSLSTKQVIKLSASASHRRCSSASSTTSSGVSDDPLSPKVGCMGQVKRNNKVVGFPPRSTNTTACTSNNMSSINKCHEQIISNYNSNGAIVKYHMLKRLFSSKSLATSPTAAAPTAAAAARSRTHKGGKSGGRNSSSNHSNNRGMRDHDHGVIPRSKIDENCTRVTLGNCRKKNNNNKDEDEKGSFVNLMDLDPPLPVVKQKQKQQEEGNNGENVSLWKRRSKGAPLKSLQVQVAQQITCNNNNNNLPLEATTV